MDGFHPASAHPGYVEFGIAQITSRVSEFNGPSAVDRVVSVTDARNRTGGWYLALRGEGLVSTLAGYCLEEGLISPCFGRVRFSAIN